MDDLAIDEVKKKSLSSIIALTSRTFALQLIAFGATFLLTIFLSPSIFGVFYVVSAIISFLTYFSDVGLAAALIQKKEKLTDDDLQTTFTIQQILVITVVIVALGCSGIIAKFYKLDQNGLWLFRSLALAFFLSSLKTIPSVVLERKLDFQKLIIPQLAETVLFYGIAVFLAWKGLGIQSFTWAVLGRAIIGLVIIYILSPWKISFGISSKVAHKLLRFGVPFQINSLLALVKDDLMTVFLGKILSFSEIGYIGWAKKWAEVPLRLIMDSVVRVTFPAFSRLQHSEDLLKRAIEKTLFGLSLTIFPITVALLFFIQPLIHLIPKYGKWSPAVFSFSLFALVSAVSSLSVPLTNTLNAVGKIKTTLKLMIMWTILTWVLTILFVHFFGFNGVSIAMLVISISLYIVIRVVRIYTPFNFFESIGFPLLGSTIQAALYFLLIGKSPYSWIRLLLVGSFGVILYIAFMWMTQRGKIKEILHNFHI